MHKKELIYFVVPIFLVIAMIFIKPALITSPRFSFSIPQYESHGLNLIVNQNVEIDLNLTNQQLNFFAVSGIVEGDGNARVRLVDGAGKEYVVYEQDQPGIISITGFTSSQSAGGYLSNECQDTCVMDDVNGPFKLIIEVDDGTTLKVANIAYR